MAATVFVATNNTGAQTQIDINHSSTWQLSVNTTTDFGGGVFAMKSGSASTDTLTLSLYLGTDATGTLLRQVTLDNTTFCAQTSSCTSFVQGPHLFEFSSTYQMQVGENYYLALTSSAVDSQSTAYFIKSDAYFASDSVGTAINPSPFGGVVATPEPSTMLLSGLGLVALGLMQRKVRR